LISIITCFSDLILAVNINQKPPREFGMMVDESFKLKQFKKLKAIAKKNKGLCLSKRYVTAKTKLRWKCQKKHIWSATPDHVLRGQWCRKCGTIKAADKKRSNIHEMRALARKKNGKCLSEKYIGSGTKLLWQCNLGHIWPAVPESITAGTWCPYCSGNSIPKKERLKFYKEIAKQNNGKCLSRQYQSSRSPLEWECEVGHRWSAVPASIRQGNWCEKCLRAKSGSSQRGNIKEMQKIANDRGGECISQDYVNSQTELEWKCHYGHEWKAVPNSVKQGSWCPDCNFNIGEEICRSFFESVFETDFPKTRPSSLTYKGRRLELDGYSEELKIAFEHQGIQHFKPYEYFGGEAKFKELKKRDVVKRKLCKLNGIKLLEVIDLVNIVKINNIEKYMVDLLTSNEIPFDNAKVPKTIKLNNILSKTKDIQKLQSIANTRGGSLRSKFYLGANIKLDWQCQKGHTWLASPSEVRGTKNRIGTWCPKCAIEIRANKLKGELSEFQTIAKSKNGKCISTAYINSQSKLIWECEFGHRWSAVPNSIKQGTWCSKCSKKKST